MNPHLSTRHHPRKIALACALTLLVTLAPATLKAREAPNDESLDAYNGRVE